MEIKLLIADDDSLFANLLSDFLSHTNNIEIIDVVSDGYEVIDCIEKNSVDLLLLDLAMPNLDGMETMKQLKRFHPDIRIIVLSSNYDADIIEKALRNGASGYLTKTVNREELLNAITKVSRGEVYYCKASVESIMSKMTSPVRKNQQELPGNKVLTGRELEVLKYIVDGWTSAEIAKELNVSARTVITHRQNMLRKLVLKNVASLINYAIKEKLV